MGIALTEPWERDLLTCFMRAVIASAFLQGTATNADVSATVGWVREHISSDLLAPLASGTVVIEFADTPWSPWTVCYEFEAGGHQYRWVLDGMPSQGAVLHAADAGRLDVPAHSLAQKVALGEERVPLGPLTLDDLLPPQNEARMLTLDVGPQWADLTREFAALAGIPVDQTQRQNYSLAHVLRAVLSRGLELLGDLRQPPRTDYTAGDVVLDSSPADGSRIPARLYRPGRPGPAHRVRRSGLLGSPAAQHCPAAVCRPRRRPGRTCPEPASDPAATAPRGDAPRAGPVHRDNPLALSCGHPGPWGPGGYRPV